MKLIKKWYLHLLVFILIYIEFGYQMVVAEALPGSIRMLVITISTGLLFFMTKKISVTSIVLLLYSFALVFLSALRDDTVGNSVLWLIPIFSGFVIATSIPFLELARIFNSIIVFLASYSLVTYAISLVMPSIIASLPYLGQVYESRATMHNALFSVCISNATVIRNYGIAWEPGAFALLLCVALFSLIAFEDKLNKIRIVIVVIAILTTFSTMGYFVMSGIFMAFMFQKKGNNAKVRKVVGMLLFVFIVLLLVLPSSITDVVFQKLSGLFSDGKDISYTTQARLNAIIYPFLTFSSSPIIGAGYDQFAFINKVMCDSVATNTILNWYAILGILGGVPFTFFFFKFIINCGEYAKMSGLSKLILLASAVLLVSTESLLRISLIYVLIFYAAGNQHSSRQKRWEFT